MIQAKLNILGNSFKSDWEFIYFLNIRIFITFFHILHSRKKEGTPTLHDGMDGTGEHYAKWNKPGSEGQIPYDLTYKWNLINKTNRQNITRDIEINNKPTVTKREGGEGYESISLSLCPQQYVSNY